MNFNLKILANITLRGSTLISKFLLLFILAKYAEPSELGVYGLITVSVSYLLYLLGLDFYTYSTREIITNDHNAHSEIIKNQTYFHLIVYAIVLPFVSLLFAFNIFDASLIIPFYFLLILEHIAQELNRILIAIGKVITASVVLFFRSGLWCYIAGLLIYFDVYEDNLIVTLIAWIVGAAVATGIGFWELRNLPWKSAHTLTIDWQWIKSGLSVAALFFFGTLCLRGIYTADRYIVNYLSGITAVGVYTFYMGACNAYSTFIDASVVSFRYVKMVESYRKGDIKQFLQNRKSMLNAILAVSAFVFAVAIFLIEPVVGIVGREEYLENIPYFFVMLGATFFITVSLVSHYSLYAFGEDKVLSAINFSGIVIFLILSYLGSLFFGGLAAVIYSGFLVSVFFSISKQFAYIRFSRNMFKRFSKC